MMTPIFDEARTKKAMKYLKQGLITDLEEIGDGIWSACIQGTELYDTRLTLHGETITQSVCSCPDDLAQYCKHVIAVYMAILYPDKLINASHTLSNKSKSKSSSRRSSLKSRLDTYVMELESEELSGLITLLRANLSGVDEFLAAHVLPPSGNTVAETKRLLKQALVPARRSGYFDYVASQQWLDALDDAFALAERIATTDIVIALQVCVAIYDVAVSHAGTIDDSNGEFSYAMDPAIEKYYEIAASITDKQLLNKVIIDTGAVVGRYAGDGWYSTWSWLKPLPAIVQDSHQANVVEDVINDCLQAEIRQLTAEDRKVTGFADTFGASMAAEIRYQLIAKFENEDKLQEFVASQSEHHIVRELYTDHLLVEGNYTAARQLCEQGIELDKDWRGVVVGWIQRLQRVAQATDDRPLLIRTARSLFEIKGDVSQLETMKTQCTKPEWKKEYQQLISQQQSHGSRALLHQLYIFENKLYLLVESLKGCGLEEIDSYHKLLQKSFPSELADLYLDRVDKELELANGRGQYQYCARMLRRAKKLGKTSEVARLVSKLIAAYPMRRAMIEELQRV